MDTPIVDFVRSYAEEKALRMHMPGHKGVSLLGCEKYDITEIEGADSLYEAKGIIARSEQNASGLFGCRTFYSTEGSSQCIRAMLHLAMLCAKGRGACLNMAAGRNAHRSFLSACALLDVEPVWIYPGCGTYLSCPIGPEDILALPEGVNAVYVTSPDYLGNTLDIATLAAACHKRDMLLLVDNAHGAYLKFLQPSRHPMDLGADICCDSAHKTLPALTGAAYLHVANEGLAEYAKAAMALFGSTSPSYLILQSLDAVNKYLADCYPQSLAEYAAAVAKLKAELSDLGYELCGDEPLKICIRSKSYGYYGTELAAALREKAVVSEFSDPDHLVLMLSPENGTESLFALETALSCIEKRSAIESEAPPLRAKEKVLSPREAVLSPREIVPAAQSVGRILADAGIGCPPAVPVLVCGERIDQNAIDCFEYYGIESCTVLR